MSAVIASGPIAYVIAVFDSGKFSSYWGEDADSESCELQDAFWYETRASAVDSMLDIPRRVDARIYELVPSPEPSPVRSIDTGKPLPSFLLRNDLTAEDASRVGQ